MIQSVSQYQIRRNDRLIYGNIENIILVIPYGQYCLVNIILFLLLKLLLTFHSLRTQEEWQ